MDEADRADERTQNVIDGQIAIATEKAKKIYPLVPCGKCYYCDHKLKAGRVFCDASCKDDYYHLLDREKANGI